MQATTDNTASDTTLGGEPTARTIQTPTLADHIADRSIASVKLHLGCGGVSWRDFINVDLNPAWANQPDSARGGCVAGCLPTCGTVDHRMARWMRYSPRTLLIISPAGMPLRCSRIAQNQQLRLSKVRSVSAFDTNHAALWPFHPIIAKRRLARTQGYGDQWDDLEYETHRYVWRAKELKSTLFEIGFTWISVNHRTLTDCFGARHAS